MAQKRLPTHAKTIFDTAMPAGGANMLLSLHEHTLFREIDFLSEHRGTLRANHNWGGIGSENATAMNVLLWAYKDQKISAQQFEEAMVAYNAEAHESMARKKARLLTQAVDDGMEVFFYDARQLHGELKADFKKQIDGPIIFGEYYSGGVKQDFPEILKWDGQSPNLGNGADGKPRAFIYGDGRLTMGSLLVRIDQLLEGNPAYRERLGKLEARIQELRGKGYNADMIGAALLVENLPKDKNSIVIPGGDHVVGTHDLPYEAYGVLDDSLRAILEPRGRTVYTGIIAGNAGLDRWLNGFLSRHQYGHMDQMKDGGFRGCVTRNKLDFVYNADTDRHLTPPSARINMAEDLLSVARAAQTRLEQASGGKVAAEDVVSEIYKAGHTLFSCGHIKSIDATSALLPLAGAHYSKALRDLPGDVNEGAVRQ